ncbi:hypothetical protein Fmac_030554 [Flemingia macrophylla]|uniref:Transcription factor CBF/NF-Y/archaeal histone domain-containing protein n=1 Tax=Flemingia macrophylla TaxID=520843 RepID=A0ABD1KZH8_9FABA
MCAWRMLESKGEGSEQQKQQEVGVKDNRYLPNACVQRIMRKVLPEHAKVSEESKEKIAKCATEFISFITVEANHYCQQEQRRTITAEDLIQALKSLAFGVYAKLLVFYLHRYREQQQEQGGNRVPHRAAAAQLVPTVANVVNDALLPPFVSFQNPTMADDGSINIGANANNVYYIYI